MKDMFGNDLLVGDVVLKPESIGRSPMITKRTVTKIDGGKLYLDNSKVAIIYPSRLVLYK